MYMILLHLTLFTDYWQLFTHTCATAVVSDEAGSTKEAKACTKKAVVLFLEGFGY